MTKLFKKSQKQYALKNFIQTLKKLDMYKLKSYYCRRISNLPQYCDDKYMQENFYYNIIVEYYDYIDGKRVVCTIGYAI